MKKGFEYVGFRLLGVGVLVALFAFIRPVTTSSKWVTPGSPRPETEEKITWYSWEEAIAMNAKTPKKLFVDVYTDWCGWCKKMDASTFTNPEVIAYMNKHFIAVKLNAEQKENILYEGHTLKYMAPNGGRGVHELAYALLDGNMGYPAFVYLDETQKRITISPGYKESTKLMPELTYIAEEVYKTKRFEDYMKDQRK